MSRILTTLTIPESPHLNRNALQLHGLKGSNLARYPTILCDIVFIIRKDKCSGEGHVWVGRVGQARTDPRVRVTATIRAARTTG
uniref:Uncharacterized protein n=1 Tax=Triticum urartu TaxID=4572 RepID=A0A8R7TSR3_TRIUA